MISESRATESSARSPAQTVAADVVTAVRSGTSAVEAEALAIIGLEQAYQQANDAAAELKRAIKAEAVARVETVQAQNGTKQPIRDEEKASRAAGKAGQVAEHKATSLKARQAKLTRDEMAGKRRDPAAAEKVKLEAEDAARNARAADLALERAREASEAAKAQVGVEQEKAKLAAARVRAARIADAGAKRHVELAEGSANKAIEAAKDALTAEVVAKKTLDRAIKALKATMLEEARAAQAAAAGTPAMPESQVGRRGGTNAVRQPAKTLKALKSRVTRTAGRLSGVRRRASRDLAQIAVTTKTETGPAVSEGQPDEIYTGMVKLLIFGPVDQSDVNRLREGLEQVEGLRVMSVGGSSAGGICIAVLAEQPVPLVSRLVELDVVDKVSKRGRDVEVRLTLPALLDAGPETASRGVA